MKLFSAPFVLATVFALTSCQIPPSKSIAENNKAPAITAATPADADQFIADVNRGLRDQHHELTAAEWVAQTYINTDSELLNSKAHERSLTRLKHYMDTARQYETIDLKPETRHSIDLLKRQTNMLAPKDPNDLAELTTIASRLEATYGAGKYCKNPDDEKTCRKLDQLSEVLAKNRDWNADLDAWEGWHNISRVMRKDYMRFAELLNKGAQDAGYHDAGEVWRAGYDMDPEKFRQETDRLWGQVEPLYKQLQCYAHDKLQQKYGDKMPKDGTIPAHITGNMWAQDWAALYPLLQPYPGVSNLDVDSALVKQKYTPVKMTERAEDFYQSIGFPALPKSFYTNSQFVRPRDREVVCHASAWDLNLQGDVRIKMCFNINEEDFSTIYHELGHIYYYLAYNPLPFLYQASANDGFHEAIGDTIQLSLTPAYLHTIGLAGEAKQNEKAILNAQMKLALQKIAFLPFSKSIDEWRWGVFDGSIKTDNYNAAWWALKRKYQGISAPSVRTEEDFDAGAKYHVAGNTPYIRYFLSYILQFQFQRELCKIAGFNGPLNQCSIYGSKEAGAKYWAMLQKGASQPWQQTLKEMIGQDAMDASAIIDYFQPLYDWLKEQNQGKACGWAEQGSNR